MGRRCPVCGRGMFRQRKLKSHIRRHHPEYYFKWIFTGKSRTDEERKKRMKAISAKKKKERLEKMGIIVKDEKSKKKVRERR